jgi:hypothetical protein
MTVALEVLEQLKSIQYQLETLKEQMIEEFGSFSKALDEMDNTIASVNKVYADVKTVIQEEEAQPVEPQYKDISDTTIEQIRALCNEWRSTLKPGDPVFVMYSLTGWADSEHSFTSTVKTATQKRLVLSDDCRTTQKIFHRDGGRILNGVSGCGDWLLMPPFFNPKDLQQLRLAAEAIERRSLLDNVPTERLLEIMELLKPYQ